MPVKRFAASVPGIVGALQGALKRADQVLGGWLPGGGVASPVTKAIQAVTPSTKELVSGVRDQVAVPILDRGIESGVLPTKEAMFARYLSGTSKPLTVYPGRQKQAIQAASDTLAIEQTRDQVDEIFKSSNPLYQEYSKASAEASAMQRRLRNRSELGQGAPSPSELAELDRLQAGRAELEKRLGLSALSGMTGSVALSNEQRKDIISRHELVRPGNLTVGNNSAYGGALPREVQLSLGSFEVRDGEIRDRYKFDGLENGRTYRHPEDGGMVYPDALGGGTMASDLIELGLKSGVITPRSGYDIRVPLER
jgi:hypothetical protein